VPRADSRSFIRPNPDGVAEALQVLANAVSGKFDDPRYVFSHDPTRSNLPDQARKLRPEISVVVPAFPLACHAEGLHLLAGETSVDKLDWRHSCVCHHLLGQFANVLEYRYTRPALAQDGSAKGVLLAERGRSDSGHLSG
jgi:hypothetical protein